MKDIKMSNVQNVILIHGLWMNGMEMYLLKRRLKAFGFQPWTFRYATTRLSPAETARHLNTFVEQVPAKPIHFVGHSLGGLIALKLFEDFPYQRPGRLVVLGTPYQGSETARRFIRLPCSRYLINRNMSELLEGIVPPWHGDRDLGVIAGTLNFGLGRLIGGIVYAGDGTISVEETHIPQACDFINLPVSHMGLVFSKKVAAEVCHFLKHGIFSDKKKRGVNSYG